MPALEDKIVQGTVAEVLNAIYEVDFLGFSYGFRPGRNPHQALQSLHTALMTQCVNWVLDADIRKFFDSVDQEWLLRMLEHRIADPRVLRLIRQWLTAGVLERGEWHEVVEGTPQGAGISPLLANIFLHYVLDLWVHQWRRRKARGRIILVRYADDFVMGLQYADDARRMLEDLKERLAKFKLTLHADKTRLIEFGRMPTLARARRGQQRPETFAFLGFTHYCGRTRDGRFVVKRKTHSKRANKQAECATAGGQAQDAYARFRSAPMAVPSVARTLRVLWVAEQLPLPHGLPSLDQRCLVQCTETSQPAATQLGNLRGFARAFLPSASTDHSSLHGVTTVSGLPSGRAVCGKSARTDLRGQKPNGFATRPISRLLATGRLEILQAC